MSSALSLNARLVVSASVALVAFLSLAGWTLDRAFRDSALSAARDRLTGQVYLLLGAAELDSSGALFVPEVLPEARFASPASGLYGEVLTQTGDVVWRSPSMVSERIDERVAGEPGEMVFSQTRSTTGTPLLTVGFGVLWETGAGEEKGFNVRVAETRDAFDAQVVTFRRSLWGWFAAACLVLVTIQGVILRWSLKPLREVGREVAEIEAGERAELTEDYPSELQVLTRNLNVMVKHNQARLHRQREALENLAHSLKTPLAVLQNTANAETAESPLRSAVEEQAVRIQEAVDYQLQRAAMSGRSALTAPVDVPELCTKLAASLKKVYADKRPDIDVGIASDVVFYGDSGDLIEVIGNLTDNACKWCAKQVRVHARNEVQSDGGRKLLLLTIEDDGPGIAACDVQHVLGRGARMDEAIHGQGLGLAVVRDIVEEAYGGALAIERSALGGACVVCRF